MNCTDVDQVTKDAIEYAKQAYSEMCRDVYTTSNRADDLKNIKYSEKELQVQCGLFLLNDEHSFSYEIKIKALTLASQSCRWMSATEFIQKVEQFARHEYHNEKIRQDQQGSLENILLHITSNENMKQHMSWREDFLSQEQEKFNIWSNEAIQFVNDWQMMTEKEDKQLAYKLYCVFERHVFDFDGTKEYEVYEKIMKDCRDLCLRAIRFPEDPDARIALTQDQKTKLEKDFERLAKKYTQPPTIECVSPEKILTQRKPHTSPRKVSYE